MRNGLRLFIMSLSVAAAAAVSGVGGAEASPAEGLPDPLVTSAGKRVDSARMWTEQRRPELLELFRTHVYGRAPVKRPANMQFKVESVTPGMMDGQATRKQIAITFEGPGGSQTMRLLLFVPTKAVKPAPVLLLICNRGESNIDPTREKKEPFWPAEEMIARGYAAAAFQVAQIAPDKYDGFKSGVHALYDQQRSDESWGTIAAWAWGASRAMDYFETDRDLDAERVAVVGHSRGGKTSLWAGAEDERFALVVSNDSGCTGAAITRGKKGERIADINKSFPHWFSGNYKKYNGREDALPVDQHELIALIAPRPVYVASASEDTWADPDSEFRSAVEAGKVYKLFGLPGVGADKIPAPESPLQSGAIGYHLRTGKHGLTLYDWQRYMDFADKRLRRRPRIDTVLPFGTKPGG
jgi:dienelactone hydrolase